MADTGFSHAHTPPILFFFFSSNNNLITLDFVTHGQQKSSSMCIRDLGGNITYLCSKGITSPYSSTVQAEKSVKMATMGKKKKKILLVHQKRISLSGTLVHKSLFDLDASTKLRDWQSLSNVSQASHIPSVCLL